MKNCRIEVSIENGVKWVRRYRKLPKDRLQQISSPSYLATYKCNLCSHVWQEYIVGRFPLSEKKCIINVCGNPSFVRFVIRVIRGQKNTGFGEIVKIEADLWEP